MLWKASVLPITFRGSDIAGIGGERGGGSSLDSVGGGVTGVVGDVGGCGSVTGGACGKWMSFGSHKS